MPDTLVRIPMTAEPDSPAVVATRFTLAALATWRVTHLLAEEDGPADVVVRLRKRLGDSTLGGLMDCFGCLSFWVAAPASRYVARTWGEAIPVTLALSGAACLLERTCRAPVIEGLMEGGGDGMLRTGTSRAQERR